MRSFFLSSFLLLNIVGLFFGCEEEKLTPEQETAKYKKEIVDAAPIKFDYEVIEPSNNLSQTLKKFSGHWVGRWGERYASQLIVTEINSKEAKFIYSWEGNNVREIEGGAISEKGKVQPTGRIIYQSENESLTFAIDTLLNKVIGVHLIDDEITNIVMEKYE